MGTSVASSASALVTCCRSTRSRTTTRTRTTGRRKMRRSPGRTLRRSDSFETDLARWDVPIPSLVYHCALQSFAAQRSPPTCRSSLFGFLPFARPASSRSQLRSALVTASHMLREKIKDELLVLQASCVEGELAWDDDEVRKAWEVRRFVRRIGATELTLFACSSQSSTVPPLLRTSHFPSPPSLCDFPTRSSSRQSTAHIPHIQSYHCIACG